MTNDAIDISNVRPISHPTENQWKRFLSYEKKIKADPSYRFSFPEAHRLEYIAILRGWFNKQSTAA